MIAAGEISTTFNEKDSLLNIVRKFSCSIILGHIQVYGVSLSVFVILTFLPQLNLMLLHRRLLPETALSRVFFPSNKELKEYFSPAALPQGMSAK